MRWHVRVVEIWLWVFVACVLVTSSEPYEMVLPISPTMWWLLVLGDSAGLQLLLVPIVSSTHNSWLWISGTSEAVHVSASAACAHAV